MFAASTTLAQFMPMHHANGISKAVLFSRETTGSMTEVTTNLYTTNINSNHNDAYNLESSNEEHYPASTKERIIILIVYACLLVALGIAAFYAIKRGTARKAAIAQMTQANEVIIVTVNDDANEEHKNDAEVKSLFEHTKNVNMTTAEQV